MNLAIEHLKKHWLVLAVFSILLGIILNFNTILYFLTSNKKSEVNILADVLQTRMFFSPADGNFKTGDLIAISVLLDSTKDAINTVAGEIVFPSDKLEIKSISTKNSINTFWIPADPYFSTSTNTIIFSGGLPTPGFLGIGGNIITVIFHVKMAGHVELKLINTTILANDGLGTAVTVPNQLANFNITTPMTISYSTEDLNRDAKVDLSDLSILVSNWGTVQNKDVDFNSDGVIDVKDVSILLSKLTILIPQK